VQPLALGERRIECLAVGHGVGGARERQLDMAADARQRTPQIVRQAIDHGAHARGQALDLVQHPVGVLSDAVELIADPLNRQTRAEVALDDGVAVRASSSTRRSIRWLMMTPPMRLRTPTIPTTTKEPRMKSEPLARGPSAGTWLMAMPQRNAPMMSSDRDHEQLVRVFILRPLRLH
jgi:hypothetical protein